MISLQFTGTNQAGQLGIGCGWTQQFGDDLQPLDFGIRFIPELMDVGGKHSCFASTNGSMVCFGSNGIGQVQYVFTVNVRMLGYLRSFYFHQLGYGDTVNRPKCGTEYADISSLPAIDLGPNFDIAQIMAMKYHTCALSTNDELKCWGE